MSNEQKTPYSRREFIELSGIGAAALAGQALLSGCSSDLDKDKSVPPPKVLGKIKNRPEGTKVRIAVAGGNFGLSFFFNEHPNCEVTAVTDLRQDRRKKLETTYNCQNSYESLEELLEKENNIDAVAVFTDGTLHFEHAMACLDKGYHVFSAVPACTTLEEADKLRQKVLQTGLHYTMAETSVYGGDMILAKELWDDKKMGEVFYSELEYYHDLGNLDDLITNKDTRFWNPDGTPSWRWGLPPMLYSTHATGGIVGLTEERMISVSALGWGQNGEKYNEHPFITNNRYQSPFWNCSSLMQTDKGHMTRMNIFWLTGARGVRFSFYGSDLTFHGPKSWATKETKFYERNPKKIGSYQVPNYYLSGWLPEKMRHTSGHRNSHTFLTTEFIDSIVENRTSRINIHESLAMTAPGIVAHESALKNGEQLKVPNFD